MHYAYSREEGAAGCKYAQDAVWREREEVRRLFAMGARAYICGSSRLGKGVADVVARIVGEAKERKGEAYTIEQGLEWWESLRGERFAVDVFD
jgi:cytochrome P450/NADPH-cytochrome P450 reductase